MQSIAENIMRIRENIAEAARRSGRKPAEVRLMAVTKTVDDERIRAAIEAGVDAIGENYVQEARRKIELMGRSIEWHLIGHLQTNKAKYAVRLFDMIHSVNRPDVARELDRRAAMAGVAKVRVLIEVNTSGEETKRGVAPEGVLDLVRMASSLEHLSVVGLMTMAPWFDHAEKARPYFRALRKIRDAVEAAAIPGVSMTELSMGMTDDYPVAVEEGATIVRIGRAIFGERK